MREIYIKPKKATIRYGCDFCKRTTARKVTMERHEKACYYNPDRVCPNPCCTDGIISYDDLGFDYPGGMAIQACDKCKIWNEIHLCPDDFAEWQRECQKMVREN